MDQNLKHIKYLLVALLVLGSIALAWNIYSNPVSGSEPEPIVSDAASEANFNSSKMENKIEVPDTLTAKNSKMVKFDSLGSTLNSQELNSVEHANLKKLNISENASDYNDESFFGEKSPRILEVEGSKDRFILTMFSNNTVNGSEESSEVGIANLATGEKVAFDIGNESFYDYLNLDYGNKLIYSRYVLNNNGSLSLIVQLDETQTTFKNKTTCSRAATMLKIDTKKNVLSIVKKVNLPGSNNQCGPVIDNNDPNHDSIYSSFYESAFAEAITTLNGK